ncbi:hypothetical protein, partial [Caballeronia sp.]|uniref:hypothetical protein n=1 Tax=Caballeronia sp. TaxID=1931223 RepID=UPI003C3A7164
PKKSPNGATSQVRVESAVAKGLMRATHRREAQTRQSETMPIKTSAPIIGVFKTWHQTPGFILASEEK